MKLFEVIPENFFSMLSSPNKHIYADALLHLYNEYQKNRFGIPYELLRDVFQEVIETYDEAGKVYDEEGTNYSDSTDEDIYRTKANALIRRLRENKWIDIEDRDQYRQFVVLPHYSSRVLGVLQELCDGRSIEYQRYAFSTYQLLTGEEANQNPCMAVLEAEKMTKSFLDELQIMINNMKKHMEQVTALTSIQEVLDYHFNHYKSKIVDLSYHRLKTSDHVAKYRTRILDQVQKWLLDADWIVEASQNGVQLGMYDDVEPAEQQIRQSLYTIEEVYRDLDNIFHLIDTRHNMFLRSSYERARYLTQHNQGIDQQLISILNFLGEGNTAEESMLNLSDSFQLLNIDHLGENSLLTPRKKRAPFIPEEHEEEELDEERKRELMLENQKRLQRAVTREKIRGYVLERMNGKEEIQIKDLTPTNSDEFLLMIYVYLYGYDGKSGFRLIRKEGDLLIQDNMYRFFDRKIIRNEEGGH